MKTFAPRLALIMLIIAAASCSKNEPNQIDQKYLNSEGYADFKKKTAQELTQKSDAHTTLQYRLQQFSDCGNSNQLELPLTVNEKKLASLIESDSCEDDNIWPKLALLGESRFKKQTIRWVLLERETAYRDQELLVAVFMDKKLKGLKTVGIFQQNPSRKITSEISIRGNEKLRITSRTIRDLLYPIDQKNVIKTEYTVSSEGIIREL